MILFIKFQIKQIKITFSFIFVDLNAPIQIGIY